MKLDLSSLVLPVRAAMTAASEKAQVRRLRVHVDSVRCGSGPKCSGCCRRMIHVSMAEALVILGHLEREGSWAIVRSRCLEQKPVADACGGLAWFKMNVACPVLDPSTSLCTAYAVRPTPCSTHFAASDPEQCGPWSTARGPYVPVEMTDVHDEFMRALASTVDGAGILAYRLPIPTALLLAEGIRSMTGLTLDEVTGLIRKELR